MGWQAPSPTPLLPTPPHPTPPNPTPPHPTPPYLAREEARELNLLPKGVPLAFLLLHLPLKLLPLHAHDRLTQHLGVHHPQHVLQHHQLVVPSLRVSGGLGDAERFGAEEEGVHVGRPLVTAFPRDVDRRRALTALVHGLTNVPG